MKNVVVILDIKAKKGPVIPSLYVIDETEIHKKCSGHTLVI